MEIPLFVVATVGAEMQVDILLRIIVKRNNHEKHNIYNDLYIGP